MYLIEGTVEKSIYDISVRRRMSQISHASRLDGHESAEREAIENQIEAANSLALQQTPLSTLLTKGSSGGELVGRGDLWDCLFAGRNGKDAPGVWTDGAMAGDDWQTTLSAPSVSSGG